MSQTIEVDYGDDLGNGVSCGAATDSVGRIEVSQVIACRYEITGMFIGDDSFSFTANSLRGQSVITVEVAVLSSAIADCGATAGDLTDAWHDAVTERLPIIFAILGAVFAATLALAIFVRLKNRVWQQFRR